MTIVNNLSHQIRLFGPPGLQMGLSVTRRAERDQVLRRVVPQVAPPLNVMDLEFLHSPTRLASPAISFEDFSAELPIGFRIKP